MCKAVFEPQREVIRQLTFEWAIGGRVPLWRFKIIYRNKGRFAAHCEANVAFLKVFFHVMPHLHDIGPLLFGIRFGYARVFVDTIYVVIEFKRHLTNVGSSRYGGCAGVVGGTAKWDVAFTGK